ncbi:MAG: VCBS repeat-containing protein [Verrucomicrobiales bacterium]|nr:VCBS repeat-containing protein [Verrucomicrobiales bacterium]
MLKRSFLALFAIAIPVAGFFLHKDGHLAFLSADPAPPGAKPGPEKPETPPDLPPPPPPKISMRPDEPEPMLKQSRADQVKLDRYSGKTVTEILVEMKSNPKPDSFLAALPEGPFPFSEGAVSRDPEAVKTILINQQGTIDEPTLLDRWRVNLAHVALGSYPDSVPKPVLLPDLLKSKSEQFPVVFEPAAEAISVAGWHRADFDSDGDQDVFVVRSEGLPNSLLVNENEEWDDQTEQAGLLAFFDSRNAFWVDLDLDGLLDLVVGNADAPVEIYRNAGAGKFESIARKWLPNDSAGRGQVAVADFDGDLFPDLAVGGSVFRSVPADLLKDWRFAPIFETGGRAAAVASDFDNDGDMDLVTADPGAFFLNDGDGIFTDVTGKIGLAEISGVSTLTAADLDRDGFDDLLIGTVSGLPNRAFWNRDGLFFREVTATSRLGFLDDPGTAISVVQRPDGVAVHAGKRVVKATTSGNATHLTLNFQQAGNFRVTIVTRDPDWVLQTIDRTVTGPGTAFFSLGRVKRVESVAISSLTRGSGQSWFFEKSEVPLNGELSVGD